MAIPVTADFCLSLCHFPVGLCAIVQVLLCVCVAIMVGVQGYKQGLG